MGVDAADVLLVEVEGGGELALALLGDLGPAGWIAASTLVGEHHAAHDLVRAGDEQGRCSALPRRPVPSRRQRRRGLSSGL